MMDSESGRESKPQPFDLTHHETVEEIRNLPDAEIEQRHDVVVQALSDTSMEAQERQLHIERAHAYRGVLAQRQSVRQAQRMEGLTRSMNRLSWVVVLATIAGVGMRPCGSCSQAAERASLDSSRPEKAPTSENSVTAKFAELPFHALR